MRMPIALASALLAVCLASLWPAAPLDAQSTPSPIKMPPDFTFPPGKDTPGPVTFSHEQHKAKVEKCTACHVKLFKMKKGTTGPLLMDKMKAGEQCGACHNGKMEAAGAIVFSIADEKTCEKCHKK